MNNLSKIYQILNHYFLVEDIREMRYELTVDELEDIAGKALVKGINNKEKELGFK